MHRTQSGPPLASQVLGDDLRLWSNLACMLHPHGQALCTGPSTQTGSVLGQSLRERAPLPSQVKVCW